MLQAAAVSISPKAAIIAGCPTVKFEVYADTPARYKLPTPARIHVKNDFFGTLDTGATYYFGFASLKQKSRP